ncbi:hypothetical protein HY029_00160 [Candidatus Gottesmanbacteria bacterium]|nr:hypothetical protein [Candidatus Gottesmanbacteria bacterium]
MNKLNILFTLSSLNVLLVTAERFSFTTKILLAPYSFLRLHEVFQISVLLLFTVIIPFLILREATGKFDLFNTKNGAILALLFVIGVYFYSTGNGVHELGSFLFNQYCDTKKVVGEMCGGMFFNDYYFGNILYFIGAILMNIVFLFFERMRPNKTFIKKDMLPLAINGVIYSFAIFAYAAFDRVLVGFIYSLVMTLIADCFYFLNKKSYLAKPVTTYLALTYSLGTIASIIVRFR